MTNAGTKIRVVIAEDHALLRVGLKILLEQRGVVVVGGEHNYFDFSIELANARCRLNTIH